MNISGNAFNILPTSKTNQLVRSKLKESTTFILMIILLKMKKVLFNILAILILGLYLSLVSSFVKIIDHKVLIIVLIGIVPAYLAFELGQYSEKRFGEKKQLIQNDENENEDEKSE